MSAGRDGNTEPYPRDLGMRYPTPAGPLPALPPSEEVVVRRRPRWPWITAVVVVLVAVLAVGGELLARGLVASSVRDRVIAALDLPTDQRIDVETTGVVLLQLIGGRLDSLHLSSDRVALGPLVGAATVDLKGVPLGGGAMDEARGVVRLTAAQFTDLAKTTGLPIREVMLSPPDLTAAGEVTLLGAKVPLSVTITPGAEDGQLTLTPVAARIGGVTLDADAIRSRFGSMAEGLVGTQRVCIAGRIPAGLRLTSAEVTADAVVIGIDADGAIGVDPALREKGTCPAT